MKKVIYTCIMGDYDTLKEPAIITKGWDYVCYTNQPFKSDVWQIKPIESTLQSNAYKQRERKIILPKDYDLSIWIDGSMKVNSDLDTFVTKYLKNDFTIMKHPSWSCITDELNACIRLNKDDSYIMKSQVNKYLKEGYPLNNGMVASGVMIKRNTPEVNELCDNWANEVLSNSIRDQLSFGYVAWKHNFKYDVMPFDILNNEFLIHRHK